MRRCVDSAAALAVCVSESELVRERERECVCVRERECVCERERVERQTETEK